MFKTVKKIRKMLKKNVEKNVEKVGKIGKNQKKYQEK
jgi:hypothetical protein